MVNQFMTGVLVVLLLTCGCGGGSSSGSRNSDNPFLPGEGPVEVNVAGAWHGTISYQNGKLSQINFAELVQNGANLSGMHDVIVNGEPNRTDDVNGTINGTTVTISVIYRSPDNPDMMEFVYEGTVEGDTFWGSCRVTGNFQNSPDIEQSGTFALTRYGGNPPPPANDGMTGVWQGTMATPESGQYNTTFELSDTDGRISGRVTLSSPQGGDPVSTESLIGTVDNSTVTIDFVFYDAQNNEIAFTFEGSVTGDAYAGTVVISKGNLIEQGTFNVTQQQGRLTIDPQLYIKRFFRR